MTYIFLNSHVVKPYFSLLHLSRKCYPHTLTLLPYLQDSG